jgi:hypothetical protein
MHDSLVYLDRLDRQCRRFDFDVKACGHPVRRQIL